MEPRADRSGIRGLRVGGGDLIEDIHRQQRRRVIKRAAQLASLAMVLLLLGVAFKVFADRRARGQALELARSHAMQGTLAEIDIATQILDESLQRDPSHAETLSARGVLAAMRALEYDGDAAPARAAVDAITDSDAAALAKGMLAFADGDIDVAAEAASAEPLYVNGVPGDITLYLAAWVAAARADVEPVDDAIGRVQAEIEAEPTHVPLRRALARLLVHAGRIDEALVELAKARELARSHVGLAADEALYNAHLHQELSGVASVADQLLGAETTGLGARDEAHARLARAVVHVHSGEREQGLEQLDGAWPGLAPWDDLDRRLAIVTALEAGDGTRAADWAEQAGLPDEDVAVYRAWSVMLGGDVMEALEDLSVLPQSHPRVAYLQALALVEQGRYREALPWIERTEKLLPGRIEVEVARARAELHIGDKAMALRKLRALAEEEPYAPRAFTGLGEAYLMQEERDLKKAERALQKAVDREPVPAAALLGLARVWQSRSKEGRDPEAEQKALGLLEKAAKVNSALPLYEEELALWLTHLAYEKRALPLLRALAERPAIRWPTVIELVRLEVEQGTHDADVLDPLLAKAEELGADEAILLRERARIALARDDAAAIAKIQGELVARVGSAPLDVDAWIMLSHTHRARLDRKAAELALRKGIQAVPTSQEARLYHAWAELESRTGKLRLAAPRSRHAWIGLLEEDRPARELLACADLSARMWLRQGKDRVALSVAERLTKRLSHHAEAWTIRATTELQGGEAASSRRSAQRAIDLDPEDPRAHEVLGHALLRFGQREEAKAEYEKAIALAEGTTAAATYRKNLDRL